MYRGALTALSMVLALANGPVAHACDAERLLGAVGNHYMRLHQGSQAEQISAAHHLTNLVPSLNAAWLARQMSKAETPPTDAAVSAFLDRAITDSQAMLARKDLARPEIPHLQLLAEIAESACGQGDETADALGAMAAAMGVPGSSQQNGGGAGENAGGGDAGGADGGGAGGKEAGDRSGKPNLGVGGMIGALAGFDVEPNMTAILTWASIALGGIGGGVGVFALYKKTRAFRLDREKRHPRRPFKGSFEVLLGTEADESKEVSGVDISVRGMKIVLHDVEEAPTDVGSPIKLLLPIGELGATIVWRNAHFAGLIFDRRLDDNEFQALV